ncbi:MAG: asparagine synthase (glutamine-hydrolyzing), partial [Rhodospirillales bacterium]|nr:asparagine synthase (glutamine-hydrolyzing) [Rhodospirillales bacterium]
MCGLTAIFSYGDNAPNVDEAELLRMREVMIARGPDGAGSWISGDQHVGLAHRRLAIIDIGPTGAQPMALTDDAGNIRLQITYNGEIYNFKQLRAGLIAEGRKFSTQSDTEVLLHLYDRDGVDMLRQLRGMFAFALWDEARQGLLLARDPYGIKPLYYADDGGTLRVASQVKALQTGGAISSTPNPAGHVGFFTLGYVPEPHTMYKDIQSLPAGSSLWIDKAGARAENRYFNLTREMAELEANGQQGSAEELRAALTESIEHHLVSDVPVGVFLSAGLDSASIMALTAEVAGRQVETMTLRFDEFSDGPLDEAPLAAEIATLYDTRHQTRTVKGSDFHTDKKKLLAAM